MLKVEAIVEAANSAASKAVENSRAGNRIEAHLCLIESAIYSVGAEICGRLENLHFEFETWQGITETHRTGYAQGSVNKPTEKTDGGERKESDSNLDEEGTGTTDSPEGDGRKSYDGPQGAGMR